MNRHTAPDLTGKVAFVTGASGALGADVARALTARGVRVALAARTESALDSLARELGGPAIAFPVVANVRDIASMEKAAHAAAKHFGAIDIVIAAAGMATTREVSEYEADSFCDDVDTNLNGVWRTFKATLPYVRKSRGHLCAVASVASFVHLPGMSAYAASKTGVMALCNSLRLELEGTGVTVGTINPTFFESALGAELLETSPTLLRATGHFRGLFAPIKDRDCVVDAVIDNIERRSRMSVRPRIFTAAAYTSGATQAVLDQLVRANLRRSAPRRRQR